MDHLTKEQIQSLLRIEGKSPQWSGVFDLFVQGFGSSLNVWITLKSNSRDLTDRTVQTINELANLTEDHYKHILRLLFDDAMVVKDDTCWGDPSAPAEIPPANWLRSAVHPTMNNRLRNFASEKQTTRTVFWGDSARVHRRAF